MASRIRLVTALAAMTLAGAMLSAESAGAESRCPSPTETQAAFETFAHRLLTDKDPRGAYEAFAEADLRQRNPPFGADRASTIRQWETMTRLPTSRFEILSVQFKGDVAELRFRGELRPDGGAAEVTQHDRLRCGRIVEEWAEFHPLAK